VLSLQKMNSQIIPVLSQCTLTHIFYMEDGSRRMDLLLNLLPEHPVCRRLRIDPSARDAVTAMTPERFKAFFRYLQSQTMEPLPRKRSQQVTHFGDVVKLLVNAKKILVLTGAGVSTSCGIPDFRSADGVYSMLEGYQLRDPQDLFSIHYFKRNVKPFYDFARKLWPGTHRPAPTHHFIKLLETHSKLFRNYTQNIDTLECVAGISNVLQCHGSFSTATCTRCKYKCSGDAIKDDVMSNKIPLCPECQQKPRPSLLFEFAMKDTEIQAFRVPGRRSYSVSSESDIESEMRSSPPDSPFATSAMRVTGSRSDAVIDRSNSLASEISIEDKITYVEKEIPEPKTDHSHYPSPHQVQNQSEHEETADDIKSLPFVDIMYDKGIMKPDIVFFGESLPKEFFESVEEDVRSCDLVIVAGTSLKVAPVSKIIEMVDVSIPQILINREMVAEPHEFDAELLGNCDNVTSALADALGWESLGGDHVNTAFTAIAGRPFRFVFEGAQVDDEDEYEEVEDSRRAPLDRSKIKKQKTDEY